MGRKYIKQIISQNFVYPNNNVPEYDLEIVHDINNNSVSGTVTNFTGTSISATGITISFNWTWSKNGAEPFISDSGNINLLSVHMMSGSQRYYKPFRLVEYVNNATIGNSSYSGSLSFTVTPGQLGLSSFTNGTYSFDIRFIGHRSVYPVCSELVVSTITPPTPTPTATPTATPVGPTPTPTPTPTPAVSFTSGATLNVTDPGWIKYENSTGGSIYVQYTTTGTKTITDCLDCASIDPGIPFADLAVFTVTDCGDPCSGGITPTPTPTEEPSYTYWLADVYNCAACGDGPYETSILVAFTTTTGIPNRFYNSLYGPDGNVYKILTEASPGPAYLIGGTAFNSCVLACSA
jgi:hypothetical protein